MAKRIKSNKSSEFARKLRDARLRSGLKSKEFAAMCGTSTVNLWRWENGSRTPSIDRADAILRKLGLTISLGKDARS